MLLQNWSILDERVVYRGRVVVVVVGGAWRGPSPEGGGEMSESPLEQVLA